MADISITSSAITSLASLVVGIGSTLFVVYLNRSKPRVDITEVALFAPYSAAPDEVLIQDTTRGTTEKMIFVTPDDTKRICAKNPSFYGEVPAAYTHPQTYINFLYNTLKTNELWRTQYENMPAVVNNAIVNMDSCLKDSVSHFVLYYQPIWMELLQSYVRQKFDLTDSDCNLGLPQIHKCFPVETDQVVGWGVAVDPMYAFFVIDKKNYLGPREEVMRFAHNLARAIACYDGKALKKVVAFLHEVDWECYRRDFEETKIALGRQIDDNFSRIIVRGLLVNKGKTSYAVAGAAKMRLCAEGFSFKSEVSGRYESLYMDIELRMRCVRDDYLTRVSSITVDPKTAIPFLAVSEEYLRDMGDQEAVKAICGPGSERKCQIEFVLTEQRKSVSSEMSPIRTVRIGSGEYQVAAKAI